MEKETSGPHIRSVRDLRNNYAELKALIKNHEPVFITNHGRGEAVLINIEDYIAFEDYLFDRYVASKLAEIEHTAVPPGYVWHRLKDVERDMRVKIAAACRDKR